jgi:hypothetical protein
MNEEGKKSMTIEDLARLMQGEFLGVNKRLGGLEKDVKWMKENSSEIFTKIDKYIVLYEDQKMELASVDNRLTRLEAKNK